ncbi:MAG TPA: penicillin acylase family protein, partial [Armatimonadota bacterium]|nr:penicillin acylase family protein [Armatimonadota bacterium]
MRVDGLTSVLLLILLVSSARGENVRIARDEWGVPHVFGDTPAAGCYGLGWAQAEDRLEQLLWNYRWATGTMAEAFGEGWVEHDWQARLVGHQEVSQAKYADEPADVRAAIEAFQRGVKDYMAANPDEVPDWAPDIEPWMVVALGRAIIFGWPLGAAQAKLERRDEVDLPFSSNQWAVRPNRTADGHTIMCIDPHIPW